MACFPFFVDLKGVPGLVIGGGRVALGKVERLLPFGPRLTVTAPAILPELEAVPGLTLRRRPFLEDDLDGAALEVAAAGPATHRRAAALCRERRIPVNVVDDREASTFLFPALLRRGELTVGVSTGGCSPTAAAELRDRFARCLPDGIEDILDYLGSVRPWVRSEVEETARREAVLRALCRRCLELGRPLTLEETADLVQAGSGEEEP